MAESSGSAPNGPRKSDDTPPDWFAATRQKGPSRAGAIAFTALRTLDLPVQYWLLRSGLAITLVKRLGGTPLPSTTVVAATTSLGLSPYHSLIFSLAIGSSLKQIYWNHGVNENVFPLGFATTVAVYNTLLNALNTVFAVWSVTSQQPQNQTSLSSFVTSAPPALLVGIPLYAVGLFTEWYCEVQRTQFKSQPENKGKLHSDGLFGLARNINYGGYTLWRIGYSLICGGWVWGAVMGTWLAGDFCFRAIPSLEEYCQQKVSI